MEPASWTALATAVAGLVMYALKLYVGKKDVQRKADTAIARRDRTVLRRILQRVRPGEEGTDKPLSP